MESTGSRGFTLIELMIVVVIIAILAAIAYPNYMNSVRKANRTDAKSMLTQVAGRQEQYFLNNKGYTNSTAAVWGVGDGDDSEEGFYDLDITTTPSTGRATGYELTATAQSSPQTEDLDCYKFTMNHMGERTSRNKADTSDTTSTCW